MDLSIIPPIAAALDGLYQLVISLTHALTPLAGPSATLLAIVALTIGVRLLLVPVSVAQVRAESGRRRIAPAVAALRVKYATRPEQLQKALTQLYTSEKISPLAGCLPTLAQAPVLSAVYALFVHHDLAGHANLLLTQTFAGLPLGGSLFTAIGSALPHLWVFLLLLAALALIVELARRANLRWAAAPTTPPVPTPGTPTRRTGAPGTPTRLAGTPGTPTRPAGTPGSPALPHGAASGALRFLPYLSVAFAAIAPLAAATYLVTSAAWSLAERAILRRALA